MRSVAQTIHVARDQWHLKWDRSISPIATITSGDVIDFDLLDDSCGQIGPYSTVETLSNLDFSRVDQVNGPIYVTGTEPSDTLQVEILDVRAADWGWTAIIPKFALLT